MATTKVTITLEDEQLAAIHALMQSGQAQSVSGFVKHAVAVSLSDAAGWDVLLGTALEETGGPMTAKERTWADSILRPRPKAKRARKAA
jgi:hypothetical protein